MSDEWIAWLYQLVRASYIYWPQPTHPLIDLRIVLDEPTHNALDQT